MTMKLIIAFCLVSSCSLFLVLWKMNSTSFFSGTTLVKRNSLIDRESNEILESFLNKFKLTSQFLLQQMKQMNHSEATSMHHLKNLATSLDVSIEFKAAKRVAVTCYLPGGESNLLQFILLLYGSWKFVSSHANEFYSVENKQDFRNIDLLVFCHPSACGLLPADCKKYSPQEVSNSDTMSCWFVEQHFEANISYGPINSYIMFNRTDTYELFKPYERILRSDYDVFITPALLTWKLRKNIIFGQGGYCDPFNMKRLKEIANKLGMRHQGIHCIGSTWYGETDIFIKVSKKAFEMTKYMFLNEFDPKLPGLETIPFDKNREGEWVRWWRPVSSMYGGELAFNHLVDHLSQDFKGKFDSSSCSKEDYLTTPHIHCWHNDCDFHKFTFMDHLLKTIQSRDKLSGEAVHRIVRNSYKKDIRKMTIQEYSNYIAWGGVGKYLKKWFK